MTFAMQKWNLSSRALFTSRKLCYRARSTNDNRVLRMELTISVSSFMPALAFRLGALRFEFAWPFVRLGKWSLWVERTGHKPEGGKWFEVWREDARNTHVFGFGRRLIVCRGE